MRSFNHLSATTNGSMGCIAIFATYAIKRTSRIGSILSILKMVKNSLLFKDQKRGTLMLVKGRL